MKIKIKTNASQIYVNRARLVNWKWVATLKGIEGKTLEVETDFLFIDQYNTDTMRILEESVEEVIDDARIGRQKCTWCGHHSKLEETSCPKCGKTEYLNPFPQNKTAEQFYKDRGYDMFGRVIKKDGE